MVKPASLDSEKVFAHVRQLAAFGPRLAGSPGDERAGRFILEELRNLGFQPREDVFPIVTGSVVECCLAIEGAEMPFLDAAPMQLTASTGAGGVAGPIAWVGRPGADDIGPALAGKMVVWAVKSRTQFLTIYPAIAAQSPAAIIAVWPTVGILPKHQQLPEALARKGDGIPTVCIRYEDGAPSAGSAFP